MQKQYAGWLRIAVVAAGVYLASQMTAIYLPIIIAVVISFILNPVVEYLVRRRFWPGALHIPRSLAVVLTLAAFFLVVTGIITLITNPLSSEFNRIAANMPSFIEKLQNISGALQQQASALKVPNNMQVLVDKIVASTATYTVETGERIVNFILGFASQLLALVMVPILTFYFIKDWRFLRDSFISAMPPAARDKTRSIIHEMAVTMSAYLRGQAIVSSLIGLLVFSGMYVMGVDYPLVLGLLATLADTVPIIGSIAGAIPAIILAYMSSPALAIKVIVFYLLLHQVENQIIIPKIMGKTIDLHPVLIILAMLVGGHFFGVIGIIVAVPLAALIKVLFKQLWHYE